MAVAALMGIAALTVDAVSEVRGKSTMLAADITAIAHIGIGDLALQLQI
jgi:hypothetical protein